MLPTIIIRHKKENLKKCSLSGLETRDDIIFYSYPLKVTLDLTNYILLKVDAPELSPSDETKGILLIDSTWRYLEKILKIIPPNIEQRSLPKNYVTAYPRKQNMCPDPKHGLASIEALYLAYFLMKKNLDHLLDNYYWKDTFLKINNLKTF
jgi:pre-rRNA-processing protein TSR3